MRNNVLKLLSFFYRNQTFSTLGLFLLSFLWFKISVDTHESSHSTNILSSKSLQIFQNTILWRHRPHIEQNANLRIELPAKAFEKPEVWGQFGTIGMLEAADNFEFVRVTRIRTPQILIDEGKVLFDRRWEVIVIYNKIGHSFPFKIFHFVQDDINPFVEIALLLSFSAVQLPVELNHGMLLLDERPPNAVLHQLEYAVLDENDRNIVLSDPVFSKRAQVRVDPFQRGLDSVPTLVVHADANKHFYAFEVITSVFLALGKLA